MSRGWTGWAYGPPNIMIGWATVQMARPIHLVA